MGHPDGSLGDDCYYCAPVEAAGHTPERLVAERALLNTGSLITYLAGANILGEQMVTLLFHRKTGESRELFHLPEAATTRNRTPK